MYDLPRLIGSVLLMIALGADAAADRRQTLPELGHPDQEILTQPKNPMIRDTSQLTDTDNMMIMRHLVQEPFVCVKQSDYLPPISAEAEAFYQQGVALEKAAKRRDLSAQEEQQITLFYSQAAELNHWKGLQNLSVRVLNGRGTPADPNKAVAIYEEMIRQNMPIGYYDMAVALQKGIGVKRDYTAYQQYLFKAASLGNPEALHWLGERFATVGQDHARGIRYHQCALAQDYRRSAHSLGAIYKISIQNYPKAAYYYLKAGSLGAGGAVLSLKRLLTDDEYGYGLAMDSPLLQQIDAVWQQMKMKDDGEILFPNLMNEITLPEHPIMGYGEAIPETSNFQVLDKMRKAKKLGVNWQDIVKVDD